MAEREGGREGVYERVMVSIMMCTGLLKGPRGEGWR